MGVGERKIGAPEWASCKRKGRKEKSEMRNWARQGMNEIDGDEMTVRIEKKTTYALRGRALDQGAPR